MTGLQKMIDRIAEDAKADAAHLLGQAEEESHRIATEYANRGIAERDRIIAAAEQEGESVIARAKSAVEMNRRNILAAARASVLDDAFEKAGTQMRDTGFGKYRELLCALLVCALMDVADSERTSAELGDEVEEYERIEVLFNPSDREQYGSYVVADVRRSAERRVGAARVAKLCLSEETADIDGGLILRCGKIETNCSLSVILAQIRREMEGKVAAMLFPEETAHAE